MDTVQSMEVDDFKITTTNMNIDKSVLFSNVVFMDVQGFKAMRGRIICKEICVIADDEKFHSIVKSPYSYNKLNDFYNSDDS